jgi:putative hydrolase of the HAD superfamily
MVQATPTQTSRNSATTVTVVCLEMMVPVAITTVLFDFYGTLARPAGPSRTLRTILEELGVVITDDVTDRWHVDQLDGIEHIAASVNQDAYEAWEDGRWTRLLADADITDPAEIARVIAGLRASIRDFVVTAFDETHEVLATLRASGLRLGVCSNWHWDLDGYLAGIGVAEFFPVAVSSAHAGARKPHPRIYAHTLERVGASAASTLFVGDSWQPDVIGPIAAGMRSVHIHRSDAPALPLPNGATRGSTLHAVLERINAAS